MSRDKKKDERIESATPPSSESHFSLVGDSDNPSSAQNPVSTTIKQEAGKQGQFNSADVNAVVGAATLFQNQDNDRSSKKWTDTAEFLSGGNVTVKMKTISTSNDTQVFVHPTTDMIMGFENAYDGLLRQFPVIRDGSDRNRLHIIPEIASGRLPGSGHIRLVVVEQLQNQSFADAYKNKTVFDPRDLGLRAQNTFDDTNCGRYVAAMTIQAAGLARDGLSITKENLKASPAVRRALHFNSREDAKKGLENAYVKPLSKNPASEEIIEHNLEKIKCLKAEYESRVKNPDRAYHGTAIFGGYISSVFKAGYSAKEKLGAVKSIEKELADSKQEGRRFKIENLPKAAKQGELGKCVKAIQEEMGEKAVARSEEVRGRRL